MSSQTPISAESSPNSRKAVSLMSLAAMFAAKEPIAMLTAYDASFARLADLAGVDCLLVGDSLGMTMQGERSTLSVSLEAMAYHTRCVAAARTAALVIGDLPFASYHESRDQAMRSAGVLMQAGAQMVKLEGGWTAETVAFLVERGIPVCGHLGLTPQSVHALSGYRVQGKSIQAKAKLKREAAALAQAGASMIVIELVPSSVVKEVCVDLSVPIIGIGAGNSTGGQVLVLQDMLGITQGKLPRFVKNFMEGQPSVLAALQAYVAAVKSRSFPDEALHGYSV